MRLIIPFYLILIHQISSNSVFGMSNGRFSVALLLNTMIFMATFALLKKGLSYKRIGVLTLLGITLGLWSTSSWIFKYIGSFYLIFFVAYYIVILNGFRIIKTHLTYIVVASLILSAIQISGVNEFVHSWNSQFMDNRGGRYVQDVDIIDITSTRLINESFDSRQVRANGIFHSSAVLGGAYVAYIALVFGGFFRSNRHFYLIPWLIIFSGSKLVLFSAILMLYLAIVYGKLSLRTYLGVGVNLVLCGVAHVLLYGNLLEEQFSLPYVGTSIDARFRLYFDLSLANFIDSIEDTELISYLSLLAGTVFGIYVFKMYLDKVGISYVHYILAVGLFSAVVATPHIGNLLFGLFFLPAFFSIEQSRYTEIGRRSPLEQRLHS